MSDEPRRHIIEWDMMDRYKYLSFSVINSLLMKGFLYPLTLVKTRLQVQKQNTVYSGSFDAFKKIIRTEGCRGLYRGFAINSITALSNVAYVTSYEKTRDLITNYSFITDSKTKAFLSGGACSAISNTLVIPFDVISQHIMMVLNTSQANASGSKPKSTNLKSTFFKPLNLNHEELKRFGVAVAIIRQLYREGGLRSFYRGYIASLICYVPTSAIFWTLYEYFRENLHVLPGSRTLPDLSLSCVSAVSAGAIVSTLSNPLDLLRANIQVHRPSSYRSAFRYLWKEDRWRIFNKGLSARCTQGCISSAILIFGYETLKRFSLDEKYRDQVRW